MGRPKINVRAWVFSDEMREVVESAEELIEFLNSDEYHEDRLGTYESIVFESIMVALYGPELWEWYREKQG